MSEGFTVVVHKPSELKQRIPERMVPAVRRLRVEGVLSSEDVRFLQRLASRTTLKDTLGKRLEPFFDLDLADATIPEGSFGSKKGVTRIPADFMRGSTILRRIVLPINTEHIGKGAFQNCKKLREIQIPMGVKSIDSQAFSGDGEIINVALPRTLRKIGNGCFENCVGLQEIVLHDGLEEIGSSAFKNTAITKILMPETVRSIGAEAFANTAIEYIEIPRSLNNINFAAFDGCKNLQSFYVSAENRNYSDVEGMLTNKERTAVVRVATGRIGTCKIPEGITGIDDYAFSGCGKIREVKFPQSLKQMGKGAFKNCVGLGKVEVSSRITVLLALLRLPEQVCVK